MKQKRIAVAVAIGVIVGMSLVAYFQLTKIEGIHEYHPLEADVDFIFTDNDTLTATFAHPGGGGGYGWADDNIIYVRITGAYGMVYSPTENLILSMAFTLDNLKQAGAQAASVSFNVRFPATKIGTSTPSNLSISALVSTTSAEGYFEVGSVWLLKISNLPGTPNENTMVAADVYTGVRILDGPVYFSYWIKENAPLG